MFFLDFFYYVFKAQFYVIVYFLMFSLKVYNNFLYRIMNYVYNNYKINKYTKVYLYFIYLLLLFWTKINVSKQYCMFSDGLNKLVNKIFIRKFDLCISELLFYLFVTIWTIVYSVMTIRGHAILC